MIKTEPYKIKQEKYISANPTAAKSIYSGRDRWMKYTMEDPNYDIENVKERFEAID